VAEPQQKVPKVAVPKGFKWRCPLSREIMRDPVMCADGHAYDRSSIEFWFERGKRSSPKTRAPLSNLSLTPNKDLRTSIEEMLPDKICNIDRKHFSIVRCIGEGSSKIVHEGEFIGSRRAAGTRRVAVLQMKPGAASLEQKASVMLKLSHHSNLVRFWGSCSEGGEQFILTEFAEHGSVLKVVEELRDKEQQLTMSHKLEIMLQVRLL
jgi:serine/threonine protein kinase